MERPYILINSRNMRCDIALQPYTSTTWVLLQNEVPFMAMYMFS